MMALSNKMASFKVGGYLGQSQSVVSSLVALDFLSSMEFVFFVF